MTCAGRSPIYNEASAAWSRAHAQPGWDCCSSRQGGPLHRSSARTAPTTTTSSGDWQKESSRRYYTTDTTWKQWVRSRGDAAVSPWRFQPRGVRVFAGAAFHPPMISRSLAALMYSGRPVEGAASGAALRCFVYFFFKSNQNAPRNRAVVIVLSSELKCQPPALRSAPACARSQPELRPRPGAFLENRSSLPACRSGHNNPQCETLRPLQGLKSANERGAALNPNVAFQCER